MTVLNAIVASSLNAIIDALESGLVQGKKFDDVAPEIIRSYLKKTRKIRFCGDNYSKEWKAEAQARKLPAIEKSLDSFPVFLSPKSVEVFEGVLVKREIESRVEIFTERYTKITQIESLLLIELFQTQILPAALEYQKQMAKSIKVTQEVLGKKSASQKGLLQTLSSQIDESIKRIAELKKSHMQAALLPLEKKAELFCHDVSLKREKAREAIDTLEALLSDELFPLPKYREMLTIL
jgi:glutamine synthetase